MARLNYVIKPFSNEQIEFTLRKAEEFTQLLRVNRYLSQETETGASELLGTSPAMQTVRQLIRKVARRTPQFDSWRKRHWQGAGCRALYLESPRASAPFIRVNCAAVPENLIESEFFGHEKGSFTGALTKREGRFELGSRRDDSSR